MVLYFPQFKQKLHDLELLSDEIHIWSAVLDQSSSVFQVLLKHLSSEEVKRAEQFYFEKDRRNFIVGRGILRLLLSGYTGVLPNQLQIRLSKYGKPYLQTTFGKETVFFNVAHSEGLILLAFSRDRDLGIDVEIMNEVPEMDDIAKKFFSIRENEIFKQIPPQKKVKAFYNCWTRKEAYIKAIGEGLSKPLHKFDVAFAPNEPARLLRIEGDIRGVFNWSIKDLKPAPGFAAALAVKSRSWRLSCWQWNEFLAKEFLPRNQQVYSKYMLDD